MVQIIGVRTSTGATHELHITSVRWYSPQDGTISDATVPVMVDFIIDKRGYAYTCNGSLIARVEVATTAEGAQYIRTAPDASTTDNLLSLPRF